MTSIKETPSGTKSREDQRKQTGNQSDEAMTGSVLLVKATNLFFKVEGSGCCLFPLPHGQPWNVFYSIFLSCFLLQGIVFELPIPLFQQKFSGSRDYKNIFKVTSFAFPSRESRLRRATVLNHFESCLREPLNQLTCTSLRILSYIPCTIS